MEEDRKEMFRKYIKNIENEETKLLNLQRKYRRREIKENELTKMQIKALCDLYDRQIEELQKSNDNRKKQILKCNKRIEGTKDG